MQELAVRPVPSMNWFPEEWDAVLRVNLTGTFDVTRNAIPHLIQSVVQAS